MVSYSPWLPWRFFHTGNSGLKVYLLVVAHTVLLTDRKLFAYGFLFGLVPMAFLTHRKLFAKGFPLDVAPLVLLTHRKLFAKGFPPGMASLVLNTRRKLSIHYIFTDCE